MEEKTQTSQPSFGNLDAVANRELFLEQLEQGASSTETLSPAELDDSQSDNGRRLMWRGAKLCSSVLHRWFNLYDFGAGGALYALPVLRRFAGMELDCAVSSNEMNDLGSRHLEERGFVGPSDSPALSVSQSRAEISWRTPWLYLFLVLVVWLLLL
jgi:hypothetical protein